jgi:oligopeptide transport system permease protein
MLRFLIVRIVSALFTIFLIITITFFLMNSIPGGPFNAEKSLTPAAMKANEVKYGLDKPLMVQYGIYLKRILSLDLGPSIKRKGQTVNEIIALKFPISMRVGSIAILFALLVGIPLGCLCALRHEKFLDRLVMVLTTIGISVPGFVMGVLLLVLFGVKLRLLPTAGLTTAAHYILPAFTLSLYPTSFITRLMRSSMLDVINQDYIRTARAKGLAEFTVIGKHALKNSILPIITYLGPLIAYILTGAFVVERIFTIPGLGKFFIESIGARDYPLIMGTTIFLAAFIILMNAIVDIAYKLVDPRIKLN